MANAKAQLVADQFSGKCAQLPAWSNRESLVAHGHDRLRLAAGDGVMPAANR